MRYKRPLRGLLGLTEEIPEGDVPEFVTGDISLIIFFEKRQFNLLFALSRRL
ncbi:MAG: hypothetical protein MUO26_06445 [Methanotrichaceae archaeon]|nr:hypothetical protein [Methanotrichaceae archaeon]